MPDLEPWYKVAVPRKEVREGKSFNPDEFAIHLEQVVSGRGTEDYREPDKFFSRNGFTRALKDDAGMVLRRLAGKTENTAPVLTLVNTVRWRKDTHADNFVPSCERRQTRFALLRRPGTA